MGNDKTLQDIILETLSPIFSQFSIMAAQTLAERIDQAAVKEDRDQWYGFYTAQKERADKLEEDLQTTYKRLNEAEAHATQMEDDRNAAQLEENLTSGLAAVQLDEAPALHEFRIANDSDLQF